MTPTYGEDCARSALSQVFDAWAVTSLRIDSPLTALGMVPADQVCLAEAVSRTCGVDLTDDDFVRIHTLGDLADALRAHGLGESSR